jgi:urea transporter
MDIHRVAAKVPSGMDKGKVRTLIENATTLEFSEKDVRWGAMRTHAWSQGGTTMAVGFSSTGFVVDGKTTPHLLLDFLDCVLRGVGQVMLQNNSYAGLLFLLGIFYNSPLFGAAVLLGTAVSTTTAMLLSVDRAQVRAGLFGFNGGLVGIALLYFLQPDPLTWGCVVFAAGCSTIVMAAFLTLVGVWTIPALTAPFVFTSLCFFLATARFGRLESTHLLPTAGLPKAVAVEGVVTLSTIAEGLFNGLAQVFFQGNVITGILFAVGLVISSRVAGAAALAGSLTGLLVAWGMGAAEPAIRSGAFGFNSVLVAIALGGVFFVLDRVSIAYALLATTATAVVFAAVSAALEPLGVPALTLPFVLVTWLFLLASPIFPRLRSVAIAAE